MSEIPQTHEVLLRLAQILDAPIGRRVGVLGLGVAGRAMALLLAKRGARVVGADRRRDAGDAALAGAGVELSLGDMGSDTFADVEALVISPGADPAQPAVRAALERGIPVGGELDVCGRLPARVAAITGTNGKSTTTALLGALVGAAGARAFVGGNLGESIAQWLVRGDEVEVAVLELSSFQLETAYRFEPHVAVMLNITPDHFDRYPDVESYAQAKQRLLERLPEDGVAVLNWDDLRVRQMAAVVRGRVLWLSTSAAGIPGDGATLDGDTLVPHGALAPLGRLSLAHPRLFGRHNRENALAAMLALSGLGLLTEESRARVLSGYLEFRGLEHRLELAGEVAGVRYINDSKATNDDAAAVALKAMDRPVVLLAGGRDKGAGYERLVQTAAERVRVVIAFGEAGPLIAGAFSHHPGLVRAPTMKAAFAAAVERARPGEAVLLAPACSSFDEFTDYKHRGREFKRLVATLLEGRG